MPQMAPMFWLNLFAFFCMTLVMYTAFTYSIKTPVQMNKTVSPKKVPSFKWKW